MTDDWYPPSRRSAWERIEGEGEPTDYSAGWSGEGDYKGEPIPRPFRVAFDVPPPVVIAEPLPIPAAEPVRPEPTWTGGEKYGWLASRVDPVIGLRAWMASTRRIIEERRKDRNDEPR